MPVAVRNYDSLPVFEQRRRLLKQRLDELKLLCHRQQLPPAARWRCHQEPALWLMSTSWQTCHASRLEWLTPPTARDYAETLDDGVPCVVAVTNQVIHSLLSLFDGVKVIHDVPLTDRAKVLFDLLWRDGLTWL